MKKVIVSLILIFSAYGLHARVHPHAIGLRLGGDGDVNGAEISYQHGFGNSNRLELDLGFGKNKHHNRTYITGIYHWNWNISGGFNWYAGPGAALGIYSYDKSDSNINIGIGGQIGIEFDFNKLNAPILLSLDVRPMWDFIGDYNDFGWGAALGVRFTW